MFRFQRESEFKMSDDNTPVNMKPTPIAATFFRDARTTKGVRVEGLDAIARAFEKHAQTYERADGTGEPNPAATYKIQKAQRPAVAFATFEGDERNKANLLEQTGVCVDVDKTSSRVCSNVMRWARARGLAGWVWATDSHMRREGTGVTMPGRACMRLVLPFARPVEPLSAAQVRAWLVLEIAPYMHAAGLGFEWLDVSTLKPEQLNFTPRIGSGVAAIQGELLDPSEVAAVEVLDDASHVGLAPARAGGAPVVELPEADADGRRLPLQPREADLLLRAVNAHVRPAADGSTSHVLAHRSSDSLSPGHDGDGLQWREFMHAMSSLYVEGSGKNWRARVEKAYKRACHAFGGFNDDAGDAAQWRGAVAAYKVVENPITYLRLNRFIEACGGERVACNTKSAPRHPYIGQACEVVSLDEARAKLAERLADKSVSREALAVPAGVGKSYATIRQALDDIAAGRGVTFTSPTHELVRQVEVDILAAIPDYVDANYLTLLASPLALQIRASSRWARTPSDGDFRRELRRRVMRAPYRRDSDRTFNDGHVDAANCERTSLIQQANARLDADSAALICSSCTRHPDNGGGCGYPDRMRSFYARESEGCIVVRTTHSFMLTAALERDRMSIRISWAQIAEKRGLDCVPMVILTPTGGRVEARAARRGEQGHEVGEVLEWLRDWSGEDDVEYIKLWAESATWLHVARPRDVYIDEDPSSAIVQDHVFDANELADLEALGILAGDVEQVAGRLATFRGDRGVAANDYLATAGALQVDLDHLDTLRDFTRRRALLELDGSDGVPGDPMLDPSGYDEEMQRFEAAREAMRCVPEASALEALSQTFRGGFLGASVERVTRVVDGEARQVPVLRVTHVIRPHLGLFESVKILDASADEYSARALLGARLTRVQVERPQGFECVRVHGTVASGAANKGGIVENRRAAKAFGRALEYLGPRALVFGYKAWSDTYAGTVAGHSVKHVEWHNSATARGVNLYENEDTVILSSLHVPRDAVEHRARLLMREAAHKGAAISEQHAREAASFQLQTAPMIQEAYRIRPFTSGRTRVVYFDTHDVPGIEPNHTIEPNDFTAQFDSLNEFTTEADTEGTPIQALSSGVPMDRIESDDAGVGTAYATCARLDTRERFKDLRVRPRLSSEISMRNRPLRNLEVEATSATGEEHTSESEGLEVPLVTQETTACRSKTKTGRSDTNSHGCPSSPRASSSGSTASPSGPSVASSSARASLPSDSKGSSERCSNPSRATSLRASAPRASASQASSSPHPRSSISSESPGPKSSPRASESASSVSRTSTSPSAASDCGTRGDSSASTPTRFERPTIDDRSSKSQPVSREKTCEGSASSPQRSSATPRGERPVKRLWRPTRSKPEGE